jgi:hypothetical protein
MKRMKECLTTTYPFLAVNYYCPKCNTLISDIEEAFFTQENNMCLGCEHIQGEIQANMRAEMHSYIEECAEANGMSVGDYIGEMNL